MSQSTVANPTTMQKLLVGVADEAGLFRALIRKLVAVALPRALTYILVFVGIVSSIAAEAGYLALIPLAKVLQRANLDALWLLIVAFAQKYQKDAGVGIVIALMLPYVAVICVV